MTVQLRLVDFDFDDDRLSLGGRIVMRRDILSIAIQRRTSAAFLAYCLIGCLLITTVLTAQTSLAFIGGGVLILGNYLGARYEWQNPYVLVLQIYQLGQFEVVGIPEAILPALQQLAEFSEPEARL
jgi:hypothetical protein